jgi:hypothetical protein
VPVCSTVASEIGRLVVPFGNLLRADTPWLKYLVTEEALVGAFFRREPIAERMFFKYVLIYHTDEVSYLGNHTPSGASLRDLGNAADPVKL